MRKQVRSQKIEEITFTPNVPGKYRYYCPVNGMEGTMVVKELTTAAPVSGSDMIGVHASAPSRGGETKRQLASLDPTDTRGE